MERFSSGSTCRALSACKREDFPNIQHVPAPHSTRARRLPSSSGGIPRRQVLPKADILDLFSFRESRSAKSASSTGFDPGHPASM